uniref:Uncharacterized protein n=1 Tax=Micrurus lemniscatus lemniscatus TaxID=129467 RepID=A0A2D4JMI7_MICLE
MNQHKVNALESVFWDFYLQKGEKGDAKENGQTLLHIGIYQQSPTIRRCRVQGMVSHTCTLLAQMQLHVLTHSPTAFSPWFPTGCGNGSWLILTLVYIILVSM